MYQKILRIANRTSAGPTVTGPGLSASALALDAAAVREIPIKADNDIKGCYGK